MDQGKVADLHDRFGLKDVAASPCVPRSASDDIQ
jgi:hypothetical protein